MIILTDIQILANIHPFYLQVKSDVRRLKGIPSLVSMLDIPNREVSLLLSVMIFY